MSDAIREDIAAAKAKRHWTEEDDRKLIGVAEMADNTKIAAVERSKPISVPRGGFTSNEDEARWLADTIAMRSAEAAAAVGISATFPTESLYELLLLGLRGAAKRAVAESCQEHAELEQTFDLRWKADQRAIKRWREEHPEARKLTMPDHADLVVWLLEQHDRRVIELLAANTREVERRREAEASLREIAEILESVGDRLEGSGVVSNDLEIARALARQGGSPDAS